MLSSISLLALAAGPLASVSGAFATPLETRASAGPHWVTYWDAWVGGENGPPGTSVLNGFDTLILSFLLLSGPADQATEWASLDAGTRSATHSAYAAAGMSIMVSAFGSTDAPTSSGADPVGTANSMATWVKTYGLDGLDVDYEDFNAINAQDGKAEAWLISFTQTLRAALPSGQYIITHAPVAPWFSPKYTAGAYTKVNTEVGSLIDWYNVQFYNQGEYTTCTGLLTQSSSTYPSSSVFEIHSVAGVDLNKIVIGKPVGPGDANNGQIDAPTLAGCVSQAKNMGWAAGVMAWEYPDATSAWITTVRSESWPVGGGSGTSPTTTTSAPSTTSTGSSGSGGCAGVPAWTSSAVFVGGQEATYGGYLWKASWWTEGDTPGGAAGVWVKVQAC